MTDAIPLVLQRMDWPQADKSAWDAMFAKGDIFDGTGPWASWSDGSQLKRAQSYGQWLSFLTRLYPSALTVTPTMRITPKTTRHYIEECEERLAPMSVANLISDLWVVATGFAPGADWCWLKRVSQRLCAQADRQALPPPRPLFAAQIFGWALSRMHRVEEEASLSPSRQAIHFRQALMIGFLISRPVRRRTLLAMDVGVHIHRSSSGFVLRYRSEDMKDKKARSFPLPNLLTEPMLRYLEAYRPILLKDRKATALWINQYGDAMTPDGLSRELPKITRRHLGVALRPHAFRHIAATSIAEQDPEHVHIIRDILGHATLDTSQKHYNRATGLSACADYQSLLQSKLNERDTRQPTRAG